MQVTRLSRQLFACVALLFAAPVLGQRALPGTGPVSSVSRSANSLPKITANLPQGATAWLRHEIGFAITVDDANGDRVTLRLLNPPPGLVFQPVTAAAPPVTLELSWLVSDGYGGPRELVFEANDDREPARKRRFVQRFLVAGKSASEVDPLSKYQFVPSPLLTGDVTGDGILDVVGGAYRADVGGIQDAGAIYVWAGSSAPIGAPTATLTVPGAKAVDQLGVDVIRLVDLDLDGVLDVLAAAPYVDRGSLFDIGAIYVWIGGSSLAGSAAPTATLAVGGAAEFDLLGLSTGQSLHVVDVTNDGQADLVVTTPFADVAGVTDAGALYVWALGSELSGTLAPTATLFVPSARQNDRLGYGYGESTFFSDVTGDGIADVISSTYLADAGVKTDTGAVYVWAGGASLSGDETPTATLAVPGASSGDQLGFALFARNNGVLCADLTGDGVADVIAGSQLADDDAVVDAGKLYLFKGGSALSGATAPTATLRVNGATDGDALGSAWIDDVVDLTGDGVLDLLAGSSSADVDDGADAGALYLWAGGELSGEENPTAMLEPPSNPGLNQLSGSFCCAGPYNALMGPGVLLREVTGDGITDVLAFARDGIHVWKGGSGFDGVTNPTATLIDGVTVLGLTNFGIRVVELTGDAHPDVVAGSFQAKVGNTGNVGALFVFRGGPSLQGVVSPHAKLIVPNATYLDWLTHVEDSTGAPFQFGDVTGDALTDVVAGASWADPGGGSFLENRGRIYVWTGGSSLVGELGPTAELLVPGAQQGHLLASLPEGAAFQLLDATQDGLLDVVSASWRANEGSVQVAGKAYLWAGGEALAGAIGPTRTFSVPGVVPNDGLGATGGEGILFADVTGDGKLDLLAGTSHADVAGVQDTGAIYLWKNALATAFQALTVPGATPGDKLLASKRTF